MPLGHGPTLVRARETPGGRELNRILMHMALGAALTLTLLVGAGGGAQAQSHPAYIRLGQAKGVLYRPDSGPAPHVGVIVIHRTGNFLSHPACTELSQRGFAVLCVNSRYDNNETLVRFEPIALDIKQAVEYLRQQPGISKVVMFGHSGGGSMIAFYEAVAENGVAYCQDPRRLSKCSGELAGLPKVDGLILADAHPGEAEQVMRGLNPSIVQDPKSGRITIDESLNPFNPRNGYNPSGKSNFTPAFQARYFQAQADEMNGLIDKAQSWLRTAKGPFSDDDVMVIHGAGNPGSGDAGRALLFVMDPDIAAIGNSVAPHKLLRNDGTVVTEIIHSVKPANPDLIKDNLTVDRGSKIYTYRSFLSSNAMRATNSLDGIDYCTSNNSAACALPVISAPLLIMVMGANDFVRDDEKMLDSAGAPTRTMSRSRAPCTASRPAPPARPGPASTRTL